MDQFDRHLEDLVPGDLVEMLRADQNKPGQAVGAEPAHGSSTVLDPEAAAQALTKEGMRGSGVSGSLSTLDANAGLTRLRDSAQCAFRLMWRPLRLMHPTVVRHSANPPTVPEMCASVLGCPV